MPLQQRFNDWYTDFSCNLPLKMLVLTSSLCPTTASLKSPTQKNSLIQKSLKIPPTLPSLSTLPYKTTPTNVRES